MSEFMNTKGPFNGDGFLLADFKAMVDKHGIKTIVETGTHLAETAEVLADMAETVYTFETNKNWFRGSQRVLAKKKNVKLFNMNSVDGLKKYLPEMEKPIMFFLDAHWDSYNPLLDELAEIAKAGLRPVIVIHDFKVPNRPDLGFDSYKGQDYTFEWIHDSIYAIYGEYGYSFHYNDKAEGAKRGVIFVYPKE